MNEIRPSPSLKKVNIQQNQEHAALPLGSLMVLDSAQLIRSTCCLNDNLSMAGGSNSGSLLKKDPVTNRKTCPSQVRPVRPLRCSAYSINLNMSYLSEKNFKSTNRTPSIPETWRPR